MNTFAQKFTTSWISGGVRIKIQMENYETATSTYSTGVTPNNIKIELYTWNSTYSTTVSGTPLVRDYTTIASEDIENAENWIFLFWKPLAAGTYMWLITALYGDDTGSLKILYDPDSVKFDSWKGSTPLSGDYFSEVMGLDSESYEKVMSVGDSFDGSFIANAGISDVKVSKSSTYYNAIKTGSIAATAGGLKGRIVTGSYVHIV